MSQPPEDAVAVFEEMASRYDTLIGGATRALSQHLLQLVEDVKPIDPATSVVLDNACGTCVVSAEILSKAPHVRIHAVDVAPNMVQLARAKFGDRDNVHLDVMPGEKLDFPDGTFTHSFTNQGILFFENSEAGAREIYRTLQPGGVAVVTSWERLGNFEDAMHVAHRTARSGETYKLPIKPEWFNPAHTGKVMREAGFGDDVHVSTKQVYYGATTGEELTGIIMASGRETFLKAFSEHEMEVYEETLRQAIATNGASYTMPNGDPGWGLTMDAIVAVCRK